ncbi:MAG: C40 family peptidase [Bacteroidales bacterium]|nr:C40 family peptidase [Bacteroidales bacterium]
MNSASRYKTIVALILVFIAQLLVSHCARRFYPEPFSGNIESSADRRRLQVFLDSGIEKDLDTRRASPDLIVRAARKYIGIPHCMGGKSMKCMDCSGLLVAVFAGYGISLPHNSEEQARYGKLITDRKELRRGDLVFFIRSYNTSRFITHSGICTGNNSFIHTSSSRGVTITSLDDNWWKERFIFGTRIFD